MLVSKTVQSSDRPARGRTRPAPTAETGLHRYCTSCSRETEHASWAMSGPATIPAIFRPIGDMRSGTTICQNCGEPRAAAGMNRALFRSDHP
jgi:hypothetical protein